MFQKISWLIYIKEKIIPAEFNKPGNDYLKMVDAFSNSKSPDVVDAIRAQTASYERKVNELSRILKYIEASVSSKESRIDAGVVRY